MIRRDADVNPPDAGEIGNRSFVAPVLFINSGEEE
jgi:hypothetical protein